MLTAAPGDRRTGDHALEAATFAAATAYSRIQINGHVTAFGRQASASVINALVLDDRRTHSGPHRDIKETLITRARSPDSFGQSRSIGVIFHPSWKAILLLDRVKKRKVSPARQVRAVEDHSAPRVKR